MSWADYGFINNDMTLVYKPKTLLAIAKAVDERYRLRICLDLADGYYNTRNQTYDQYLQRLVAGEIMRLYSNLHYDGSLVTHYRDFFDKYFSQFGYSSYNNYLSVSTFVNAICRNPKPLSYTDILDDVCNELIDDGFNTNPIPVVLNYNSRLERANNKHWIIQRQKMLNKYRYVFSISQTYSPRYNGNTKIISKQAYNSDTYYNTVNEALDNLTVENVSSFVNSRPAYRRPICSFDIYHNQICINRLYDSIIITKSFVDDAILNCHDLTNPKIQMFVGEATSVFYSDNIIHDVDLNNIVTIDGVDYYKINFNPTRDEIISILSNLDFSQYEGYGESANAYLQSGFGQFFDGANYFDFLDIV